MIKRPNASTTLMFHESHATMMKNIIGDDKLWLKAKDSSPSSSELTTVALQSFFVCIVGCILFIALCFLFISRRGGRQ